MFDKFRTLLVNLTVRHLTRPGRLLTRAWLWLAAQADKLEEKRRYLDAVRGSFVGESQHMSRRGTLQCSFPSPLVKVPPARLERAHTASEAAALSA
jgi:hypothetical protein